jgi:hypothetical protein
VSAARARELGVRSARLPIAEHVPREAQGRGHVLNVNTVAHILLRQAELGDWPRAIRTALEAEAPGRFKERRRSGGGGGNRGGVGGGGGGEDGHSVAPSHGA